MPTIFVPFEHEFVVLEEFFKNRHPCCKIGETKIVPTNQFVHRVRRVRIINNFHNFDNLELL